VRAANACATALQEEIWTRAVAAVREAPLPQLAGQLLPALSDMFDLSTTRLASTRIHPPSIIYGLLSVVSLLCALLAGYGMGASESRNWLHIRPCGHPGRHHLCDRRPREYPRVGFFQIADFDQLLVEVRASMH
jgi:hypothetical protein